ncbi:hypothetical protein P1J78_05890 [Psychromarinibacter sp. C21-152]|uniref:GAF domain-containing protein n=1 Tax=Psychromarinibacter sediminicola TaxID=3033385 RepID=A0AAE3NRD1_9RHOB|nr:hypothetical protein [Psychromarinibacter sediminicola]MDF0600254.1 hypothetical protein [Psychromarinibacter sediminicola]
MPGPLADLDLQAMLAREDAAAALFAELREGLVRDAGCRFLTASVYDLERMRSRRVYTDDAEIYGLGNFKRVDENRYFDTVIRGAQPFFSTTIEEIAEVFFDWEKIRRMGFESNLNIPAVADGRVIGTANLLAEKGHFDARRVARAMEWQPVVTLCFLLLTLRDPETATFHPGHRLTHAAEPAVEG